MDLCNLHLAGLYGKPPSQLVPRHICCHIHIQKQTLPPAFCNLYNQYTSQILKAYLCCFLDELSDRRMGRVCVTHMLFYSVLILAVIKRDGSEETLLNPSQVSFLYFVKIHTFEHDDVLIYTLLFSSQKSAR